MKVNTETLRLVNPKWDIHIISHPSLKDSGISMEEGTKRLSEPKVGLKRWLGLSEDLGSKSSTHMVANKHPVPGYPKPGAKGSIYM